MKLFALTAALCLAARNTAAFQVTTAVPQSRSAYGRLHSTSETAVEAIALEEAKLSLLSTANRIKEEFGVLVVDDQAKKDLEVAVKVLETMARPVNTDTELLKGSWTLLSSTATASIMNDQTIPGIDTSKIPFFNEGPFKDFRTLLNKALVVQQDIKSIKTDAIDRVDNIVQYQPPDSFTDFVSSIDIPDFLKSLNLNPLQVSTGKFILQHTAEVTSTLPTIQTKLSLASVVVNVAGQSQVLDPTGKDLVGINVPLGEFLNSGTFDTTYLDGSLRISRSKTGNLDQLRVFVKDFDDATGEDSKGAGEDEVVIIDYTEDSSPSDVES